tara:strand:- start:940 stop:1137 length:198 start_codon:yes stop_codon:yes gene_type:complete
MMSQTLQQKSQRIRKSRMSGWLAVRKSVEIVTVYARAYSLCISSFFGLSFFKVTLTTKAKGDKYK